MFLAIDAGNTHLVLGLYREKELLQYWRLATDSNKTEDEYGVLFNNLFQAVGLSSGEVKDAWIASVVPTLNPILERAVTSYIGVEPVLVDSEIKTGLTMEVDHPQEVGADRIVNAAGIYHLYGGPAVLVDFGTATTFCALTEQGAYRGGAIAPGIGISVAALFQHAAKLPRIEVKKPHGVIGPNSVMAMESGIYYGFLGQVKELVHRMKEELPGEAKVYATGGLAPLLAQDLSVIDSFQPYLTLEGLRILRELNR